MMIYIFIGVYVVLAILVYVMFKVLRGAINKIGEQSKTYYVDKLQKYDDLIDAKEEKLNDLNEEIKNKKIEAEKLNSKIIKSSDEFDLSIIEMLSRTTYKSATLLEMEKMVNKHWTYDNEKIVSEFARLASEDVKNYNFCLGLKRKFDKRHMYEYKILSNDELEILLKEKLSDKEFALLKMYKNTHSVFILEEFVTFIDELVEVNSPEITVFVSSKDENYDHFDKFITTKYDDSIYRGIKILYRGKIYDFSLNGGNL